LFGLAGLFYWLLGRLEVEYFYMPRPERTQPPAGIEAVSLASEDGVRLSAWWQAGPTNSPSLLYLHGNDCTLSSTQSYLRAMKSLGVSVLALDYRGYGQSQGTPSEEGLARDARAAYRTLQQRASGALVIHGHSLGGAVAARLASEVSASALILESTFSSARDIAHYRGGSAASWLLRSRFPSRMHLAKVHCPVLIIHAQDDRSIPVSMAQQLFESAHQPKQLWLIPTGGHSVYLNLPQAEYVGGLKDFLGKISIAGRRD